MKTYCPDHDTDPMGCDETCPSRVTIRPSRPFWVSFEGGGMGCVMAADLQDAEEIAGFCGPVTRVQRIPYPAYPMVAVGVVHNHIVTCRRPYRCAGRTSCPRAVACSE